jgi:replicative DNA helicase Mcm
MYRVRTASGKEVEVTPSHPLFVGADGRIEAVEAADLREGAFVATPRELSTRGDDTLDVDYRASRANNAIRLGLPDTWTPWLARLVGYVVAEGHVRVTDDHSADVRVTNEDEEILADVADAFDRLGLNYTTEDGREAKSASVVRSSSSELASFLEGVESAILERSADQRVPDDVLGASTDIQRAFLRAYVDSETHVSANQRELSVASMSRELLEGVESLLLSLGISGSITSRRNGSYRLRIGGDDFDRYVSRVGFVTDRKATAAAAVADVESNTNRDIVPDVGTELAAVREALALAQSECGLSRSTYQHYERGDRNPSRESLRRVVTAFENRLGWLRETKARVEDGDWTDIEAVRGELGLSQHDLAERMGVTQGSVSYYERNEAVPDGGGTASFAAAVPPPSGTASFRS